jgi:hypothetical protein
VWTKEENPSCQRSSTTERGVKVTPTFLTTDWVRRGCTQKRTAKTSRDSPSHYQRRDRKAASLPRRVWRITEVGSASKLDGAASHRISGSARAERTNIQGATAERSRRCNGIKCCRGLGTSIFSQRTARVRLTSPVIGLHPLPDRIRVACHGPASADMPHAPDGAAP